MFNVKEFIENTCYMNAYMIDEPEMKIIISKWEETLKTPSDSTELINKAIKESFFEIDKGAEFIIDGKRYAGKWGCDTVQHFIDILRGA